MSKTNLLEEFGPMGCFSGYKERFLNEDDAFEGPVQNRLRTDVTFLVIKIIFVIGLFGLVGYCMANGDLYRVFNGYDDCGNICGQKNANVSGSDFPCKGGDFTNKKYLKLGIQEGNDFYDESHITRECVAEQVSTEDGDFFVDIAEDIRNIWPYLILLCLIAFGLSSFFLLMYRFAAAVMVWTTLLLIIVLTTGWAALMWVSFSKTDTSTPRGQDESSIYLREGITMTIVAVAVVLVILVMRQRIRLVIQLFEEAARAVADMPLILLQPIWTILSLVVVIALWFYFALWILSSGTLARAPSAKGDVYYYKKDIAMEVTSWYNIFAVFWMSQFVISCQHMVLAGAVSTWYFTRNKSQLRLPILTGFVNLIKYHIGSVVLGSLVMAIISFIKFMMKLVDKLGKQSNNASMKAIYYCFRCFFNYFENIFNLISRNAYVEIALYGESFWPSARRGLKMIFDNIFNTAAINSIGDFVLLMTKVLIAVTTILASKILIGNREDIHYPWLLIMLVAIFTFFIAHTFVSVFEMIIDTIFICFCEDCEMNDGISKPYFMNRGLMEFVENSKKVLKIIDKEKTVDGGL